MTRATLPPPFLSLAGLLLASLAASCSSVDPAPAAPVCAQDCKDAGAVRALREMTKLMYNLTLQGKPVGPQDQTVPCPEGGSARVSGEATSNAIQGSTEVKLTYEFKGCGYTQKDDKAEQTYSVKLTGSVSQDGVLSAQSTATTALIMKSAAMSFAGTVNDPPLDYNETDCIVEMTQDGNHISAKICGRAVGFDL